MICQICQFPPKNFPVYSTVPYTMVAFGLPNQQRSKWRSVKFHKWYVYYWHRKINIHQSQLSSQVKQWSQYYNGNNDHSTIIAYSDSDPVYMSIHPHCSWPHHITMETTPTLLLNTTINYTIIYSNIYTVDPRLSNHLCTFKDVWMTKIIRITES